MKWLSFSWILISGLVLAGGTSQAADMRGDQHFNSQQQQTTTPNQNAPAPNSPPAQSQQNRPPSSVLVKPSGVLNVPSGVLNKPSGVLFKPSGVINTRPGEAHAPRQNFVGSQRDFRRTHGDGDHDGNFRDGHGSHHRRSNFIIVYVNGAPCWYPVYTSYPYYYDVPLAPTYDSGYSSTSSYVPSVEGDGSEAPSGYANVGHQWGQDLRREIATWDQFVDYVRGYIIGATPAAQADFREAFIDSYGINGAAAYDKAAEQAARSTGQGPKVINLQSGY
jgi:hypothetical protein